MTKLNSSLNAALNTKELKDKFEQQGFDAFATTPEEAGRFLAAEVQRYARLIRTRGITAN